jgi:hypothetical protein
MCAAEEDATEEAMREAIDRSTRPETASSSAAQDPGGQAPTMESSEAMREQEAIGRSLQASRNVVAAASVTPADAIVAQLDQFRLQEAERIKKDSEAATAAKMKESEAATVAKMKESEAAAAAKTKEAVRLQQLVRQTQRNTETYLSAEGRVPGGTNSSG